MRSSAANESRTKGPPTTPAPGGLENAKDVAFRITTVRMASDSGDFIRTVDFFPTSLLDSGQSFFQ